MNKNTRNINDIVNDAFNRHIEEIKRDNERHAIDIQNKERDKENASSVLWWAFIVVFLVFPVIMYLLGNFVTTLLK